MNHTLTEHFSTEEVLTTLQQMTPLKSPGPDDFNPGFYPSYWHIVGDEVTYVALKFQNDGIFDDDINFTYLVLISKIKNPMSYFDFRPITIFNVIYKIVSKVLANRLKKILPDIISKTQSASCQVD